MTTSGNPARSLTPSRVALAWLMAIGLDLLFHAGLLSGLYDRSREPSLLSDEILFRRIPTGYLTLLLGVVALAWLLDRLGYRGMHAVGTGAAGGLVIGVVGFGGLWTALEITGLLVLGGTIVLTAQGAVAGAVLTSQRPTGRLTILVVLLVIASFVLGQIAANLLGS